MFDLVAFCLQNFGQISTKYVTLLSPNKRVGSKLIASRLHQVYFSIYQTQLITLSEKMDDIVLKSETTEPEDLTTLENDREKVEFNLLYDLPTLTFSKLVSS